MAMTPDRADAMLAVQVATEEMLDLIRHGGLNDDGGAEVERQYQNYLIKIEVVHKPVNQDDRQQSLISPVCN